MDGTACETSRDGASHGAMLCDGRVLAHIMPENGRKCACAVASSQLEQRFLPKMNGERGEGGVCPVTSDAFGSLYTKNQHSGALEGRTWAHDMKSGSLCTISPGGP